MINSLSITRQTSNLTQQEVADKLGVSIVTVRKMEHSDKIKKVAHGSVIAYCQLLEIKTIEVPEMIKSE
jgi:transcriptional regulator with XRE-family HTH domain